MLSILELQVESLMSTETLGIKGTDFFHQILIN